MCRDRFYLDTIEALFLSQPAHPETGYKPFQLKKFVRIFVYNRVGHYGYTYIKGG